MLNKKINEFKRKVEKNVIALNRKNIQEKTKN